jgi:hypothetical protein
MPRCHALNSRQRLHLVQLVAQGVAAVAAASLVLADAGAPACPETRIGRVVSTSDGLRLEEAATPPLQSGDILVQLNNHRVMTCAELTDTLNEAQRNQLAALFLVRRNGKTEVVLVQWPAARPVALAVQPTAAPPTAVQPTVASPTPKSTAAPTPLTRADAAAARAFVAELVSFGRELQAREPLPMSQPWVQRIEQLRRTYAERAGGAGFSGAEPILAYYETVAQILVYKENATRGRRDVRAKSEVVLEYHRASPVEGWLQRYPFLQPSVIREPETVHLIVEGDRNGQWGPDRAVALLLEHAVSEGTALSEKLAAEPPG